MEILFRGYSKFGKKWIYGIGVHKNKIIKKDGYFEEVLPESIGQYTNINDKEGKKIFVGDVMKYKGGIGIVTFKDGCYMVKNLETKQAVLGLRQCVEINDGQIIGNIIDCKKGKIKC